MADTELIDELIDDEGLRLFPYVDTVGKTTIGVGRNLTDVGISREEALAMLHVDVDRAVADCATFAWFPKLDPVRRRAVVNLRFNLGPHGFRTFRHFIAAMARKNYQTASVELQDSRWAKQVQHDRVRRIRSMIETGED